MRVEGSYSFKVDREKLWGNLLNPDILASCIPGSEKFRPTGEDAYDVTLKVRVAAITGTYNGRMTVTDKKHLESYKMLVEGSGAGGTVKGEGVLTFTDMDGGTQVDIVGDAHVTGMIARVGQRLMTSAAKMLMNQFFDCLRSKVEG